MYAAKLALPPLAILITLASAVTARPLAPFDVWGSFSRTSSAIVSLHTVDTVKIERASAGLIPPSPEIWLLERTTETTSDTGRQVVLRWADSRACRTLIPALAKLAALEPVTIQPPGLPWPAGRGDNKYRPPSERDGEIFDGETYEIEAKGHWAAARMAGSVVMRSGAGTPAARWVDDAFTALASCWTTTHP